MPDGVVPLQQHGYGARCGGVVNVDRNEALPLVMSVEQREVLMAVHDLATLSTSSVAPRGGRW
jgi:hypothetical protein